MNSFKIPLENVVSNGLTNIIIEPKEKNYISNFCDRFSENQSFYYTMYSLSHDEIEFGTGYLIMDNIIKKEKVVSGYKYLQYDIIYNKVPNKDGQLQFEEVQ